MPERLTIHHGDALDVLRQMPDNSVDAIVTDPPYGLGKEPDAAEVLADWVTKGFHEVKASGGFMGKEWDSFVPQPLLWKEVFRVLKPGGHLLSFAGTRTYDWMVMSVRLAGFEIRDMVNWVYGSGFPKSLDVSKAIDKMHGAEREVVGTKDYTAPDIRGNSSNGRGISSQSSKDAERVAMSITAPATEAAKQWDGWGTALKPAHEPIVLARKPLSESSIAANVLRWGTGGVNVDSARINTEAQERADDVYKQLSCLGSAFYIRASSQALFRGFLLHIASVLRSYSIHGIDRSHNADGLHGKWPDRVLCDTVASHLFPNGVWCGDSSWRVPDFLYDCQFCRRCGDGHIHFLRERAQDGAPLLADALERIGQGLYVPERSRDCQCTDHLSSLDDFLLALSFAFFAGTYCTLYSSRPKCQSRFPANLIHDGSAQVVAMFPVTNKRATGTVKISTGTKKEPSWAETKGMNTPGRSNTGIRDHGDTGSAARFFKACPPDDAASMFYCAKASRSERDAGLDGMPERTIARSNEAKARIAAGETITDDEMRFGGFSATAARNHHPTVKPQSLMRYLCRLITPPNGIILDPFFGSGSTGVAAIAEGFSVIGIEQDAEFVEIARRRCKHALGNMEDEMPLLAACGD